MKAPSIKIHINEPELSPKLAEFIGILLGDGSLSKTGYECSIVLNKIYDAPYINYVKSLIFELFGVYPHFYPFKTKAARITIYSKRLFEFLVNILNLSYGIQNKNIPTSIFENRTLIKSVLRGIFDTDGSIFLSSKRKIINIASTSKSLKNDIIGLLEAVEIKYHLSDKNINITNHNDVKRFLTVVGSSNLKNIIKIIEFYKNNVSIRSDQNLLDKFHIYSNTKLPFTCSF
jgi:hypothetical protein